MKRRIVAIALLGCVLVTGCAKDENDKNIFESTEPESTETTTEAAPQEEVAENVTEHATAETTLDDPYDALLAGEGTLSFQYYMDNVFVDDEYLSSPINQVFFV